MKGTKSRNNILFILLMAGIILNILWSVRLEVNAAKVKSLVDEHHNSLKQNKDILEGLRMFSRIAGKNSFWLDDTQISFTAGRAKVAVDDDRIQLLTSDFTLWLDNTTNSAGIRTDKGMSIELSTKDNNIQLKKGKALVKLGTDNSGLGEFVQLKVGDTKAIKILEGKGIGIGSFDDKQIALFAGPDRELGLKIDPDKKRIYMQTAGNYGIGAGESASLGKWVSLKLGPEKAITLAEKKGVGLLSDDKPIVIQGKKSLDIDFEGEININAKGNININSDNGNVKINGKKILLNE